MKTLSMLVSRNRLATSGIILVLAGVGARWAALGDGSGSRSFAAIAVLVGSLMVLASALSRLPKKLLAPAIIVIGSYVVFEATFSVLYVANVIERPATKWLYEDSGRTVRFDPVRGYRLTTTPSRITRITNGVVEYVGALRGNNQGFPDRDDFSPRRGPAPAKRFAVFGDSYTAGQYLGENWPDLVEDSTRDAPVRLELLNFAVDGGGLGNWWSVLTRVVERDGYQIDGVIFAVIPGNLWRGFSVSDHLNQNRPMFGRVPTWDPATFPSTLGQARAYLRPMNINAYIVSTEEFDRAMGRSWRPPDRRAIRPYFARKVWQAVSARRGSQPQPVTAPKAWDSFAPGQAWLIDDMARAAAAMGVPVMVVHMPTRESLLRADLDARLPIDTQLFAHAMNARVVDGREAFAGATEDEVRGMWLPYDAHWGQTGCTRFARYMVDVLETWP